MRGMSCTFLRRDGRVTVAVRLLEPTASSAWWERHKIWRRIGCGTVSMWSLLTTGSAIACPVRRDIDCMYGAGTDTDVVWRLRRIALDRRVSERKTRLYLLVIDEGDVPDRNVVASEWVTAFRYPSCEPTGPGAAGGRGLTRRFGRSVFLDARLVRRWGRPGATTWLAI